MAEVVKMAPICEKLPKEDWQILGCFILQLLSRHSFFIILASDTYQPRECDDAGEDPAAHEL